MPFQKIESEKLAAAVVRQIEGLILQGILRPGERLPSERELSERRTKGRCACTSLIDRARASIARVAA